MRYFSFILLFFVICLTPGCSSVHSVRLAAGYGPFHAEIEVLLRNAEELKKINGPDCKQAAELEARAKALGAVEVK